MIELTGERWVTSKRRRERDITVAIASIPMVAPVLGGCLALSRLIDGPDPVFEQQRVGKNGDLFTIYKLRTMTVRDDLPSQGAHDSRSTRLGRLFRISTVDELPQVANILRGDLSLVGPRPLVPSEIEDMAQVLPRAVFDQWEDIYKTGGPGCFSSNAHAVHGAPRDLEASYAQRARLDIYDFEHASPAHDWQLIRQVGSTAARLIGDNMPGNRG